MLQQPLWRAGALALSLSLSIFVAACGGGDGVALPATLPAAVQISAPASTEPDTEIALASDLPADTTGLSWQWQFGDGSTSNQARPSHRWAAPGVYEVTLTVVNRAGEQRQATQSVTVGRFTLVQGRLCSGAAGSGWCWQRPQPSGNLVVDVHFQGSQLGWAVGEAGQILHTRDGGATWAPQASGVTTRLSQVRFVDALNGWANGDAATLLRTRDGGQHWEVLATGQPANSGSAGVLSPVDANNLIWRDPFGIARYSQDGGDTWAPLPVNPLAVTPAGTLWTFDGTAWMRSTDFGQTSTRQLVLDPQFELAVQSGFPDDRLAWVLVRDFRNPQPPFFQGSLRLYFSQDGGTTWQARDTSGLADVFGISLLRLYADGTGWAMSNGQLFRSTDGGSTWNTVTVTQGGQPVPFFFFGSAEARDGQTLWLRWNSGFLLTRDGGATWTDAQPAAEANFFGSQQSLQFAGDGSLWLLYSQRAYRSTDGGLSWTRVFGAEPEDAASPLAALWFFDAQRGLAASNLNSVVETTDGGLSWARRVLTPQVSFSGTARLQFRPDGNGWLMLDGSAIHRSSDRGATWSTPLLPQAFRNLVDFSFVDSTRGWALASDGTVYRSEDGGGSWAQQSRLDESLFVGMSALRFANADVGVAVGTSGLLARSTDGGATWRWRPSGTDATLRRVVFQSESRAWAVGTGGTLIASRDGGLSWTPQPLPTQADLRDIVFADAEHGWIVGDAGTVLATRDGGQTWTLQPSGTQQPMFSVFALDARSVWVVGSNGSVLATATGGY